MTVSMKTLLEAGVHFGHQTRRWNPKMKPYIFTERNGIYILDLQRTLRELDIAYRFVRELTARGEKVLLIGTKKQAQEPIANEASRVGQPYVDQRWLGGMLTNFVTMRTRVGRLEELERMETDGSMAALPKKEALKLRAEHGKLARNLTGVREMRELPGAIFVVDTKREAIAVAEARRLRIPIIGIVDTNADPDDVDFVIPGNDDAIRSVGLMCRVIADAAAEGRAALEGPQAVEEAPAAPEAGPEAEAATAAADAKRREAAIEAGEAPAAAAAEASVVEAQEAAPPEAPEGTEELEPEAPAAGVEQAPVE